MALENEMVQDTAVNNEFTENLDLENEFDEDLDEFMSQMWATALVLLLLLLKVLLYLMDTFNICI